MMCSLAALRAAGTTLTLLKPALRAVSSFAELAQPSDLTAAHGVVFDLVALLHDVGEMASVHCTPTLCRHCAPGDAILTYALRPLRVATWG